MARTLPLHPHLPAEDLGRRARQASNLVEARRWQLLALVADGKTVKDAAQLVGLYPPYARRVVHRYNAEGPDGIRDRRLAARPPRRPRLLSAEQLQELAAAIQKPAPGGGLWTGPLVARWIAEHTSRDHIAPQRGHDADPAAQAAFQESSPTG